jgi:hypothetical protein
MGSCGWFPLSHQQIRAWLDKHPEAMPRTVEDLGRYPMAFRRVMMALVTPEVRLSLWQQHLETFLRPDAGLTEAQRQVLETAVPELPAIFAAGQAPNPVMADFERRMSAVFSREEAGRIFMLIGPPEPPEGIPLPADALPSA